VVPEGGGGGEEKTKVQKVEDKTESGLPISGHQVEDHHFTAQEITLIQTKLLQWYDKAKRDLPWRFSLEVRSPHMFILPK